MKHRKAIRPGLKWRIVGYMSLFSLVTVLVLWLFQVVFLEDVYRFIKRNEITQSAQSILGNIDTPKYDLEDLVTRLSQENDVCISIRTSSMEIVADSCIGKSCILHHMPSEVLNKYYNDALRSGGKDFETIPREAFRFDRYDPNKYKGNVPESDGGMGESLLLTVTDKSDAHGEVAVFLNLTTSPLGATKKTLQTELGFMVIILLSASVILSFVMSRHIASPISKMSDEARKLATGDYKVDFGGKGYKESEELADSLNFAAGELSKLDTLQKELIANISHDLRTPLTMISGYAEMMRDIPGEMTAENLKIIIDESQRLSALVSDVMDLSKLGANIDELKKSEFSLTKTVEAVIERVGKMSACDGYKISFICDHDAIVYADETRILQVIYNLVINAINHTGEDKSVCVKQAVIDEGKAVRIEVSDTGEGIKEEDLPYIWDRYYKVDRVHKRASVGSGLGLSIVKNILKLHSASFGVESHAGKGSTFWFELM